MINEIIETFESIDLNSMDQVKLMNRTDRKYWFHLDTLKQILKSIQSEYYILTINDTKLLPYATSYYDTLENNMFISHQNGKLNRHKVRRRQYVTSGISFLEVKFKNNKGRTLKKRIPTKFSNNTFNSDESSFINKCTPFKDKTLIPSLNNQFSRITLVNRDFKERCTIDLDIKFFNSSNKADLNNLVIVEVKSDSNSSQTPMIKALKDFRVKPSGFSKYCVGRTLIEPTLKSNNFKSKIRMISKTI